MLTVIEMPIFERKWPAYWSAKEHDEFTTWIAQNPTAGDVVRGSGGVRKVRWSRIGSGKSGGVRVIYFARLTQGEIVLLTLYAKSNTSTLSAAQLKEIRHALEN